jgi:phage tail-like protein
MPVSANLALARLGFRIDPYMTLNFVVEIEGLLVGGFSEVSGLESEVEVENYREGGLNEYAHRLPGPVTYPNLVLTHGLTDINALWNWYYDVTQGIIKRKNGTIMLLDRQGMPTMWWDFRQAYPVKWVGPKFNASSATEVAVEQVELAHKGLSKPWGSLAMGKVRLGLKLGGSL